MKNKKMIQKVMNYLILAGVLGTVNTAMAANSGISDVKEVNGFYYYIGNNGTAFNNIVIIDSNLDKTIIPNYDPDDPTKNKTCGIIGGYTESGNVKNNTVYINNGTIDGYIYGGYSETGNAVENSVYINGGNIKSNVRGGGVGAGYIADNYVKINGGSFDNRIDISGGSSKSNAVITNNKVEINGGTFGYANQIYGGSSSSIYPDIVSNNIVKVTGGIFKGAEWRTDLGPGGNEEGYGGSTHIAGGNSPSGTVQGNIVEISGGTFGYEYKDDNGISHFGRTDILAGLSDHGTVKDNTIILSGKVDLTYVNLYGRDSNAAYYSNNNLVINGWSEKVNSLHYFDNIYFENIKTQDTTITINNDENYLTGDAKNDATDISSSNIHLNSISQAVNVNVNDKLTITMSGLTAEKDIQKDKVSLGPDGIRQGVATSIIGDIEVSGKNANDTITVNVTDIRAQKQTAITTESQAAAAAFVNQGNELISDSLNVLHDGEYGINTFARVSGNNSKYDTGSYVDINGWNGIVGVANTKEVNEGQLIYGAFFENGSGNYNTYNDFNSMTFRGDGNVVYNGGGLAMRYDNADGVYTEASLRAGTAKNELSNALLDTHGNKHGYKTENAYYAAHIGIGKIIKLENDKTWDIYGKYFHTHHEGDSVSITNQIFDFDSVDSDKLRIGARFNEQQGEKLRSYYGLAWEYEFSGDVGGTAAGHAMYTPSLEGSTVIGEVGFRYTPGKESPWYFDANLKGYVGMQEGISGSVQAVYSF